MAKQRIPCPVCGKEFVPCQTNMSAFNWRKYACCWDCAEIYMERIEENRRRRRAAELRQNIDD